MSAAYLVYGTGDLEPDAPDLVTQDPVEALARFYAMVTSGDFEDVALVWSS